MEKTITEFLAYLKIPVSAAYFERLLLSHADYPSLLSISDVLNRLGVLNVTGKIEKSRLNELSFPYLLQLNKLYGTVIEIRSQADLHSKQDDLQYWDGIVLHIEPTTTVTDVENNRYYKNEKFDKAIRIIFLSVVAVGLLWPIIYNFSYFSSLIFITAALGVVVGFFLVSKELGVKYDIIEKFCTAGKNSDCDKLLNSGEAELISGIKLADLVLIYFVFQTFFVSVSVAFTGFMPDIVGSLSLISFLLVPVAFYSVYYQYFRAGIWCRLCLIVDSILVMQALLFGYQVRAADNVLFPIRYEVLLVELVALTAIGCAILLYKRRIEDNSSLNMMLPKASRIKNTGSVFIHLLQQQAGRDIPLLSRDICAGDANAAVKLVMISNLFCMPCKEQHEVIEQLLETFPDKVRVTYRFVVSKDRGANVYLVNYWLNHIYGMTNESANTQKLIHDWYAVMDLEKFKKMYPSEAGDSSAAEEIVDDQLQWIKSQGILRTPTFFINDYPLPKGYELADLIAIVPSVADEWMEPIHTVPLTS